MKLELLRVKLESHPFSLQRSALQLMKFLTETATSFAGSCTGRRRRDEEDPGSRSRRRLA